jgi:hypothetical protein
MIMGTQRPISLAQLRAIAGFLPRFEEPGFQFGTRLKSSEPDGALILESYSLSETAGAFVATAYAEGLVLDAFGWPAWKGTMEAASLRDDPATLARASPDQLASLLTVLIRQERFVDGSLASAFETGLLTAILRRADAIVEETARN